MDHVDRHPLHPVGGNRSVGRLGAAAYPAAGLVLGAVGGFLSLEVMVYGFVLAIAAGIVLHRHAGRARWATLGSYTLGLGATAAWLLSPALTNRDPAVWYDPSTIPVMILGVVVAAVGALVFAVAVARLVRRTTRSL